ncbi:hypothetical protein PMAYCL1PPCAC_07662, partial [Pristionchus mayeri]
GISLAQLRQNGFLQLLKKANADRAQKIVIDYSSPNIAKRFHVGNMRSTLLGRYTAKLNSSIGHDVHSINYLGDWGRQMAIIIAYWPYVRPSDTNWNSIGDGEKVRLLTDCYVAGNRALESDGKLKEDVRNMHTRMEQIKKEDGADNEEMKQWREIVQISINHLNHFYSLFDCQFNSWMYETDEVRRAQSLVDDLLRKGVAVTDEEGITIKDGEKFHRLGKSDGASLYLTRDIASLLHRNALHKADQYIYVVDKSQSGHFAALKRVMELMGHEDLAAKINHLVYGRVKGMSTRKGRTEVVDEIMESGKELAAEWIEKSPTKKELSPREREETVSKLACASLIVTELRKARKREYEFSWQQTFDPKAGNNGIFLLEKYNRLCTLEEMNPELMEGVNEYPILEEPSAIPLISSLLSLHSAALTSSQTMESNVLMNALLTVAAETGKGGATLRVKGSEEDVAKSRLALLHLAKRTMGETMGILGIPLVTKM